MLLRVLLASALAMLAAGSVSAQQGGNQPHPLSVLPPPGLVTTGFFFPDHPSVRPQDFATGKQVRVVLGIHNDADVAYNISAIMGSLNSPTDFSIYVQNFTQQLYHQPLAVGQEISVEYKFLPDPRLEPRDFVVALTVFYQDPKGQYYSNTFFNKTIDFVEEKKLIDWELIFLFVFLIGLASGVVYVLYTLVAPHLSSLGYMSKKSKKSKASSAPRVPTAQDNEDWVKGTNYDNFTKKKAAAAVAATKAKASK